MSTLASARDCPSRLLVRVHGFSVLQGLPPDTTWNICTMREYLRHKERTHPAVRLLRKVQRRPNCIHSPKEACRAIVDEDNLQQMTSIGSTCGTLGD